ncbi:carboxypeptidase N subunit 2 [Danio aesculapii]|uniref:carboxypeptidase N subunit 2 n=1 Tax=Danio aesculapii TaxID=1142201 RepID=UPI0024C072F1|nr:carboxypeptidase N subunit 2 [Danio aesculapii]
MSNLCTVVLLVLIHLYSSICCPEPCQCFSGSKLVCSDDRMRSLPVNISTQVRELIVVASGIPDLDQQSFPETLRLSKLVFLNGMLKSVSGAAFERLAEIQELEISGNACWMSLDIQAFSSLANLTRLLLNNNKLSGVDAGLFHSLQKLETLQLRGNGLSLLSDRLFQRLQHLQELDLSFNQIGSLSAGLFQNNSELRVLSLQANKIPHLPDNVFTHLDHLEELNLRSNLIRVLTPEAFPSGLKTLILKKNSLEKLTNTIFHTLHYITYLDLSQNLLTEVPADLFQNLISLETLDLSENRISTLAGSVFKGLFSIKSVYLQKNSLTSLDAHLLKDQHDLQLLDLSNNSLRSIPSSFFEDLDFQCVFQLHGNPWRCDCGIHYFYDWLKYNHKHVKDLSRVSCEAPEFIRGHNLRSVDKEQLVCSRNSSSNSPEISVDGGTIQCSVQELKGTASIQCKVTKCTNVKFQAVFQFANGNESERVVSKEWPAPLGCSTGTA